MIARRPADRVDAVGAVGIVGAGTMGAGIAQVALEAGHEVRLYDADALACGRAVERIAHGLARRAARRDQGRYADETRSLDRLRVTGSLAEVAAGSGLVVEAAVEDLDVKRRLFAALGAAAPRTAVFATNTSALSVAAIAAASTEPSRVVGLHFFNPAPVMALVEVVAPLAAATAVVETAVDLMAAWGKTPVRCADTPGFIVNRVNRPFTLEACRVVEDGEATVDEVDATLRDAGFPMGPFELMDLIGVDVNVAVAGALYEAFGRDERFRPSPLQERLVKAGHLGRKSGEGFHRYADGRRVAAASDPSPIDAPRSDSIVERVTLAIVDEAYRALGDGVADRAAIDLAVRLGAGHPIGPFERVAALGGPQAVRARLRRLAARLGPRFEPAPALIAEV